MPYYSVRNLMIIYNMKQYTVKLPFFKESNTKPFNSIQVSFSHEKYICVCINKRDSTLQKNNKENKDFVIG